MARTVVVDDIGQEDNLMQASLFKFRLIKQQKFLKSRKYNNNVEREFCSLQNVCFWIIEFSFALVVFRIHVFFLPCCVLFNVYIALFV